jgi:outer membrane protein assembly factor BamB
MMTRSRLLCCFFCLAIISCTDKKVNNSWTIFIDSIGTYSSLRTVDLNDDDILDMVIGAGGKEEVYTDSAVIAIDGANGKRLWAIGGTNQYVGSAVFLDINNDKIKDVFIGGRWAQLAAINGADGKTIWTFFPERKKPDGSDGGWYNFTTPQIISDQDADGLADLLIANGGDARAAAGDTNRPAGRLLVLSSKTGKLLANAQVPDGKETYMSVVCDEKYVFFGTGGETIGGHLYRTTLADIMKGDISHAKILATSEKKGFVSSPVLVDINKDGVRDIIDNAVEGKMQAIDGATGSVLWQISFPYTEAYTMPAVGYFNNDSIPDLFANFAIGVFPKLNFSIRFMVDGKTGKIQYQDTLPAFQYASAVSADLDGDGFDEAIMNQAVFKKTQFENVFYSQLLAFDFIRNRRTVIGGNIPGTNLASTPWIGDLDNNGQYDFISTSVEYRNAAYNLEQPLGLYIRRYASDISMKKMVRWGGFMGSESTGIH